MEMVQPQHEAMILQDGPPIAADAPPNGSHQEEQRQEYQEWNNHERDYLEMKDSEVYQEEEEQFLIRNAVGHKGVQNWG